MEHLKGTYELLKKWDNAADVCVGGLFHSIYGTQYYKVQSADLADREHIARVIGSRAEELAFLFCTTDRRGFFAEADKPAPMMVVDIRTKASVPVTPETLNALIQIEVANFIDQFEPETAPVKLIESMKHMLKVGDGHMTKKASENSRACLNSSSEAS
ncbi:MAG TPA: hypothetical protein VGH22_15135 [Candidatus Binatia bacterium]